MLFLCAYFTLLMVLDCLSTIKIFELGGKEDNPFQRLGIKLLSLRMGLALAHFAVWVVILFALPSPHFYAFFRFLSLEDATRVAPSIAKWTLIAVDVIWTGVVALNYWRIHQHVRKMQTL